MNFCPKMICIRRTPKKGSDRQELNPSKDIAFIERIVIHIDEPVKIRFLAFHTKDNAYCTSVKNRSAEKQFCQDIKSAKYVHFQIEKEGYDSDKFMFLLAFLPRAKIESELYLVAKELCDIAEWLEITQPVNCIVFRYGTPRHQVQNEIKWQRDLEKAIKETRGIYTIGQITGRIKHIREDNQKQITIWPASLFDSINVS